MNRLLRFCVGLLLAGIGFTPFVSRAEWSGSFVVGPNGDFVTLAQAFDSLALCGISGEVLLEITSGIQTGPFVIPQSPAPHSTSFRSPHKNPPSSRCFRWIPPRRPCWSRDRTTLRFLA
ncbi:MAG: hypothetical protein IPK53_04860 [bacterium]|nr:hypothetical protein [bacterium]